MATTAAGGGRALKSLALIRGKHLAESVTTPMLLVAADGTLVFYNEAAEVMFDHAFADLGPTPAGEWGERFKVRDRHDNPFPLDAMAGWGEVRNQRPGTGHIRLTTPAGRDLFLAVCAVPLFTSQQTFEGALVLLWEEEDPS